MNPMTARLRLALGDCPAEGRLLALADALLEAAAQQAGLLADPRLNDALARRVYAVSELLLDLLPPAPAAATLAVLPVAPAPCWRGDRVVIQPPGRDADGMPLPAFLATVADAAGARLVVEPDGAALAREADHHWVIRNLTAEPEGAR
jgi:hypothetical protein